MWNEIDTKTTENMAHVAEVPTFECKFSQNGGQYMCSVSCVMFGVLNLTIDEVEGRRVVELGSYNVNGSLRPFIESLKPAEYVGVDIEKGPGVDIVCNAENVLERFGEESFDVVISTELLEHVRDWRKVISNIKNICKPNGLVLITTRSQGFPYHAYPYDFWRYELSDMQHIFSDCSIEKLENDWGNSGVFIKARKPSKFIEIDLSGYELYSIIEKKRIKELRARELLRVLRRQLLKDRVEKPLRMYVRNMLETIVEL
jgi:SAM-dependent methyltransferase